MSNILFPITSFWIVLSLSLNFSSFIMSLLIISWCNSILSSLSSTTAAPSGSHLQHLLISVQSYTLLLCQVSVWNDWNDGSFLLFIFIVYRFTISKDLSSTCYDKYLRWFMLGSCLVDWSYSLFTLFRHFYVYLMWYFNLNGLIKC